MHINEQQDNIIVFQQFDNVIEANIARTKLDAYDIPCFLTDENFVGLYPIRNEIFPGVRLCIFQKDEEQAREIMKENLFRSVTEERIHCPFCKSELVEIHQQRAGWWSNVGASLKTLFFIPVKNMYTCESCHREFSHS